MRFRLTIVLLVLNILTLGTLVYLGQNRTPALADEARMPLFEGGSAVDYLKVTYQPEGAEEPRELVLERGRRAWHLSKPFAWRANESALNQLLGQLDDLRPEALIPVRELERTGQSLSDYGLAPPAMTLTLRVGEELEQTLLIGATTSLGNRLYVLEPTGEHIAVVSREILDTLANPRTDFADNRVFDLPFFSVDSLAIENGQQRTRIIKRGEDWAFETPVSAPASKQLVEAVISNLLALQAQGLLAPEEANGELAQLEQPALRIRLGAGQRLQTLALGMAVSEGEQGEGWRLARLEGVDAPETLVQLSAKPFLLLEQAQELMRERRFMQFDPEVVTTIDIRQGALEMSLHKLEAEGPDRADTWQIIERSSDEQLSPMQAESAMVERLLTELTELQAEAFVSDAPAPSDLEQWGLAEPFVEVHLRGESLERRLLLGNTRESRPRYLYARRASQPFVYGVRPGVINLLQANALVFRERELWRLPEAARVQAVRVWRLGPEQQVFAIERQDAETWEPSLESLQERESAAVQALLQVWPTLRARSFLQMAFEPLTEHPWRYRIEVEMHLPGGGQDEVRVQTLYVTERLGGTRQFGGTPSPEATFLLDQALMDALSPLTFERQPPAIPDTPEEVLAAPVDQMPAPNVDTPPSP